LPVREENNFVKLFEKIGVKWRQTLIKEDMIDSYLVMLKALNETNLPARLKNQVNATIKNMSDLKYGLTKAIPDPTVPPIDIKDLPEGVRERLKPRHLPAESDEEDDD
jgi:hypothetical protein